METVLTARPRPAARPDQEWIFASAAARILGCNSHALPGLAERGLIGRRAIPGTMTKYRRADVEGLARRSTTEAVILETVGPEGGGEQTTQAIASSN